MTEETVTKKLSYLARGLLRRGLAVIGVSVICCSLFAISEWTIDPRLRARNADLQAELHRLQARLEDAKQRVHQLRSEVSRLQKDPNEILYHARNGLGMVKPGETVYRFEKSRRGKKSPSK